jgi:Fe-S oxidoreductase
VTALWAKYGYSGAWYGHFGQGCVHTRNNFDLASNEGLQRYRGYVTEAAELVVSLGGSLSGEHGDGQSRGELLEVMFGPALTAAFGEFKQLWDPDGLMNPGKVVDAYPLDANIRYSSLVEPVQLRPTGYAFDGDAGSLMKASLRCVGVGRCRRDDTATMCPSYRATRDEVHSTRGRAKVLSELFQSAGTRVDGTQASWRNQEVREALDLCLSCKACASDCPTHVDMATYKSEFYAHFYKGRLRPAAMYAMGLLPLAARAVNRSPAAARWANGALNTPVVGPALKRLAGVTTRRPAPRFDPAGRSSAWGDDDLVRVRDRDPAETSVVVWPDTFTSAFNPGAGRDVIELFQALGETVAVPSAWACCGRTLYDFGLLDLAKRWLERLVVILNPWAAAHIPVVVPEPSCLAAFRDELPALLPGNPRAARLASLARSPAEHIVSAGLLSRIELSGGAQGGRAVLHPHCHQRAVIGTAADQAVLRAAGFAVDVLDAGCCGLAGSFGFDAHHEPVSRKIGEELWLPKVRAALSPNQSNGSSGQSVPGHLAAPASLVIDGFSCRAQLEHLGADLAPRTTTLAALVRSRIGDPRPVTAV